jgi:DinB superfamily
MNQQSHDITAAFLQAHHDLLAFVECCGAEHWQALCPDEGRSVGVLLHHVALGYAVETDLIKAVATGQPLPALYADSAEVDRFNAAHAERHHECTKQETVALLQQHAAATLEDIQGLSEAELCRTARIPLLAPWLGDAVSARQLIEGLLPGHIQMHLAAMKAVTCIA